MKSQSEKPAEVLVNAVNRLDWNPHLFAGALMGQPIDIQRRIVDAFVIFLTIYKRNHEIPELRYRTDSYAYDIADSVDLTEFDR
jgi:hypothetical protein